MLAHGPTRCPLARNGGDLPSRALEAPLSCREPDELRERGFGVLAGTGAIPASVPRR